MKDARFRCFERKSDLDGFSEAMGLLLAKKQAEARKQFIDELNTFKLNHGDSWIHANGDGSGESMHVISSEMNIPFSRISQVDMGLIHELISAADEDMQRQFSINMYQVIGGVAESVGNVVAATREVPLWEMLVESIKKIEFGVGRDGKVSLPQIHMSPRMAKEFSAAIKDLPAEVEQEVDRIVAEKSKIALEREKDRRARFKVGDQ
ncbi:hypothetical protein RS982_02360 [Stenotrophomonas indicatrix]|uniref:hypothetical protein n=1 Tax=Stenotrophomonas indicatrix TaxID=2045451 RepID=UPI0028EA9DE1|nr:hypothetical protein [Stenotrophomonas indicatrix]MDT9580157.1 hypothetical protein [Stenotrophomonas indicatrix]